MFYKEVLEPFLKSIEIYGAHNAFCINDRFYTYNELAETISKVRAALQKEDISSKNIGLVANDDIETYASIFAIWLEGFAYVPLHPRQPIERSLEVIDQAEVSLLLDSNKKLIFTSIKTIKSKKLKSDVINIHPKNVSNNSLAYILFTSGSTGSPKGVQITRKNVGAFIKSFWKTGIQINENDRCLQCFDLTFDVSVQSYLIPLTKGACAYTIPHDQIKYSYVYGLLEDHQLTFAAMVPSMIRFLRPYFKEINALSMRYNILTAEASPLELVNEWSKCIPNAEIYNFYGPTEATIYCTYHKFSREGDNKQLNGMMSIGKAMAGLNSIIIDEEQRILGINQKGELCISGDQLTTGYWKNPEKNKESFFETDFGGTTTRFYKTGDSCYIDDDGDIMLAGRLDNQVKIQGYRIELGEIEYHAREFLKGQNAVAAAYNNQMGNTEIALFIEGTITDETFLMEYLSSKMPFYMLPNKINSIDLFPLNENGKIDRNKIKKSLPLKDI
jgi:D-alanine--poly(phosphoribitol) ligase subunit 1